MILKCIKVFSLWKTQIINLVLVFIFIYSTVFGQHLLDIKKYTLDNFLSEKNNRFLPEYFSKYFLSLYSESQNKRLKPNLNYNSATLMQEMFSYSSKFYTNHSYIRQNFTDFQSHGYQDNADYSNHLFPDNIQPAWITHYYSKMAPTADEAWTMAVSNEENIYVTGSQIKWRENSGISIDICTVKFNLDGKIVWAITHNDPGGSEDSPTYIAVDNLGNVLVTGRSMNSDGNYDYITIKYNPEGSEQWVVHYNGPANGYDIPEAITTDDDGNIYVTGISEGFNSQRDIATIKYNMNGQVLWVACFNGSDNLDDWPNEIAVDVSGNIYVTGGSAYYTNNSSIKTLSYDFMTIKYDNNGNQIWVKQHFTPIEDYSEARAITVDDLENVFVTGNYYNSDTWVDYLTIKYDSDGVEDWTAIYDGPSHFQDFAEEIGLDRFGNVFVAGYSWGISSDADYAVVKYNSNGNQLWVNRYDGPANYDDVISDMIVDSGGNAYFTGSSWGISFDFATIKCDSHGIQQWIHRYNGPGDGWDNAMGIDSGNSGNIYVAGSSWNLNTLSDYTLIKYNKMGTPSFISSYNDTGGTNNWITDLAIDNENNTYVTGYSMDTRSCYDYATVKYNSEGEEQWIMRFNGSGNWIDIPEASSVDIFGNIYVTGWSYGSSNSFDYVTIKYGSDGNQDWVISYNSLINADDAAFDLVVDKFGNIYVTGISGSYTGYDYLTVKYNSNGVQQWSARYNGPTNLDDYATTLAVDDSENVYVTGYIRLSNDDTDYCTIKYNKDGHEQWVALYDGYINSDNRPNAIIVDNYRNVYVTGYSWLLEPGSSPDFLTIKYNSDGILQWVDRYDGPANSRDEAIAIIKDKLDNIFVTGFSYGIGTSLDYATIKYDPYGNRKWVARYNNVQKDLTDWPVDLVSDSSGNVYVTGWSSGGSETHEDFVTIKYNSEGIEQWAVRFNNSVNLGDFPAAIAIDDSGNIFVGGTSIVGYDWGIYTIIKYNQTLSNIEKKQLDLPEEYSLFQNYPNPFNSTTNILYSLPVPSFVKLELFNILGEEIKTIVNDHQQAGKYEVQMNAENLPSGLYFYQLKTNKFSITKKMLLLR